MTERTVVVGTGFLGAAIVEALRSSGSAPLHTFRQNRAFPESIRFDMFKQSLPELIPYSEVGTLIFSAKVEDVADSESVVGSMRSLLRGFRGKRIVYVSSDAVFDGRAGMYTETSKRNPLTTYGRIKAAIEDILPVEATDYCIVRPSYIYGLSRGQLDSRLSTACAILQSGDSFYRYTDMYKSPTEVNFLARTVVWASRSSFQGVLHVGGDRLSVYDFFRKALAGLSIDSARLRPERVPQEVPPDLLTDTSLDCGLLRTMYGERQVPIETAFRYH